MRLWASVSSPTFDELAPRIGTPVEVSFSLHVAYLGRSGIGARHGGFPLDLSAMGERSLVQLPELGRTMTAACGTARRVPLAGSGWILESQFPTRLYGKPNGLSHVDDRGACEAVGSLHLFSRENDEVATSVRIHRFQSLCLQAHDPRFGQWFDVTRYGDLGSDPDVMGAPVCVAELDVLV